MGLFTSNFPPVDPATFTTTPYRERIKALTRHWVDYGGGQPKYVMLIYIGKMLVFGLCGVLVATLTSDLSPLDPSVWWDEPIFYQKVILWVVFVETLGIGGAWGPLCGHFKPMTGGIHYWARPNTIRQPPWPRRVPLTRGDTRTVVDIVLYFGLLASLVVALALPGVDDTSLTDAVGANEGLVAPAAVIPIIVLLVVVGLRDKVVFLAARSEQWLPALVFFAFYPFVDMIVAAKLLIVAVWFGAGVSKLNRHFENVIPPMVSNTPWLPFKGLKRRYYTRFPDDLRPSGLAKLFAHVGGAIGELIPPWILLFSQNKTLTVCAAIFMIGYHVFIVSTFPQAVPLEWNLTFIYLTVFLFLGYPAWEGYAVGDMNPALLAVTVIGLLLFPVLGELRPDLVSFLPSLRQYAGNWATSMWAFAPGAEDRLDEHIVKRATTQKNQLAAMHGADIAEVALQKNLAFRAMHSQGRGLNSVLMRQLGPDVDRYDLRDGEGVANVVLGWNFGDGHLHGQALVESVQQRCQYAPGELVVVFAESEPIGNGRQQYMVMDAAVGVVERGSWSVKDAVHEQPWLPNGPIPMQVDWQLDGYARVRHAGRTPGLAG